MSIEVKTTEPIDASAWDAYVLAHPRSILYHLYGWKNVIEKTYGHQTYYLMAVNSSKLKAKGSKENRITGNDLSAIRKDPSSSTNPKNSKNPTNSSDPSSSVVGILPLVHLRHFLFGNSLISIPFFRLAWVWSFLYWIADIIIYCFSKDLRRPGALGKAIVFSWYIVFTSRTSNLFHWPSCGNYHFHAYAVRTGL